MHPGANMLRAVAVPRAPPAFGVLLPDSRCGRWTEFSCVLASHLRSTIGARDNVQCERLHLGLSHEGDALFVMMASPERPLLAGRITVPEIDRNVARHMSRRVTPSDPGEFCSFPKVAESLSNSC